ncbi:MAG: universal stress protein [Patulibacter sp.]
MSDPDQQAAVRDQIVVGHDGSDGGRDALALAVALADAWGQDPTITVVGVYPYDPSYKSASDTYEAKLAEQTEGQLTDARALYSDRANVRFTVVRGSSPAQALDARAIVVGRSHTNVVTRPFLGSATEQALHGSPCAVVVAPVGWADRGAQLQTIGVAYDGGENARHAAEVAGRLAAHSGAALRILRVVQTVPLWYGGALDPFPLDALRADAEEDIAALRGQLGEIDVTGEIILGDTRTALEDPAGIDLLVVGSRGFGAVRRVVLGSTSTQLVRHAKVPVVVVPRIGEDEGSGPRD